MLAQFKIERAKCCGSHHLRVLNSHATTAFYECKKCGKQFHGAYKAPQEKRARPQAPPPKETGEKIIEKKETSFAVASKCPECSCKPTLIKRGKQISSYKCNDCEIEFFGA